MKIISITALTLASGVAFGQSVCDIVQPDGSVGPATTTQGVIPEYCPEWKTGDVGQECVVNLGYDFGLKVDGWSSSTSGSHRGACDGQGSCSLDPEFDNTVIISNNDGLYFDWTASPFAIGAVVVKGGPEANVFTYDPAALRDTGLYAPINANNNKPFGISHVSFCWNKQDVNKCYGEETAWAVGSPYNKRRGNWAMYVEYNGDTVVTDVQAGKKGKDVGDVVIEPSGPDNVKITVTLDGAIFYYDLASSIADENLKVQPYDTAPEGNPAPGLFGYKLTLPVGSTEASIIVPAANFYGIHMDVAVTEECSSH